MCLECRVLGAVIHHNKKGVDFLIKKFSNLDFRPLPLEVKEYLIDVQSEEYLSATLNLYKSKCGIDLKVIKVDSDGSCLPYAVSRCLIGKEILYDILRQALHEELSTHESFYKELFQQGMSDSTWKTHWEQILEESLPTRGRRTGRWLGPGEHLIGMANVLARPILLLDELSKMKNFDGVSSGLFLPIRLTRQEVLDRNFGTMPSPIVIGWANEKKNHFVALIRTNLPFEEERQIFLDDSFLPLNLSISIEKCCFSGEYSKTTPTERNTLRKMEMTLQVPTSGPNEYVSLKDSETNEEIKIAVPKTAKPGEKFTTTFFRPSSTVEKCFIRLFVENSATPRSRLFKTLELIIDNITGAYLMNDMKKIEKVSKLKMDNLMIKTNILNCSGGLEFLQACGFQESGEMIEFQAKNFGEKLINIRDALSLIANNANEIRDVEGQVNAGDEIELFGPKPAAINSFNSWEDVREQYAFDGLVNSSKEAVQSRRSSGVWIFGSTGKSKEKDRKKLVDSLMQGVHKDFETVSKNSELEKVDWDDVLMFNKRLMHVKCPDCGENQEWTGPVDGMNSELHSQACSKCAKPLKAEMTGARKLLAFVGACSIDGEVGATRCPTCSTLNLGNEKCTTCVG